MSRQHNRWLQLIVLLLRLLSGVCEIQYPSIYWTPSNPIFESGSASLSVLPMSKIHFVCPNPSTILRRMPPTISKHDLYENIWFVSENSSYEKCKVEANTGINRLVTKCNQPLELRYNTVVFQPHSADDGLMFAPGHEYYFIATSNGSQQSIGRTSGGHCISHNMKLKVYVCKGKHDPLCQEKLTPSRGISEHQSEYTEPTVASEGTRPVLKRKELKCYVCQECGRTNGEGKVCLDSDLNNCLWKSRKENGRQVITRKCWNTTSCTMEKESCKVCEVLCCTNPNPLCNTGTTSASSQLLHCLWKLLLICIYILMNIILC